MELKKFMIERDVRKEEKQKMDLAKKEADLAKRRDQLRQANQLKAAELKRTEEKLKDLEKS